MINRELTSPTREDVAEASRRLRRHLAPTPLLDSHALGVGALLKLDSFQPTGSFKVRGALAALSALPPETQVVTASAGNHARGVAWVATQLGLKATVVVPETASSTKLRALEHFPVRLRRHGTSYDDAERYALGLASRGARYVSAYNDRNVIAGQGTLAVELLEQLGENGLVSIVCPVGGGGLCAGMSLWASARANVQVVGVEAEASPGMSAAITAGGVVPVDVRPTLADGGLLAAP